MADHWACGHSGPDRNAFRRVNPPDQCAHPDAHVHRDPGYNGDTDLDINRGCHTHHRRHPDHYVNGAGTNLDPDTDADTNYQRHTRGYPNVYDYRQSDRHLRGIKSTTDTVLGTPNSGHSYWFETHGLWYHCYI